MLIIFNIINILLSNKSIHIARVAWLRSTLCVWRAVFLKFQAKPSIQFVQLIRVASLNFFHTSIQQAMKLSLIPVVSRIRSQILCG